MVRLGSLFAICTVFLAGSAAAQDTVRSFQRVDDDGNPIGSPVTIVFPDAPTDTTIVEDVRTGQKVEIPDSRQEQQVPETPDMVPYEENSTPEPEEPSDPEKPEAPSDPEIKK
jgi:hypothetical protein